MNIIKPPRIKKGDTIGIVAPAYPLNIISEYYIKNGIARLNELGFSVKFGDYVNSYKISEHIDARKKAQDIMRMFEDKNINIIMAAIGGHNSKEVLDYLDYDVIANNPKIFTGYSDITAINNALYSKIGLVNFSGPAFVTFCPNDISDYTICSFIKTMSCINEATIIKPSEKFADDAWYISENNKRDWKINKPFGTYNKGKAMGQIIGGNLETFLELSGGQYFPELRSKILFAEFAETTSKDRVISEFKKLRNINSFNELNGIVIGRLPSSLDIEDENSSLETILQEVMADAHIPIIYNVDFGHTDPIATVPLGIKCEIDTKDRSVKFLEAAVI